MTTQVDVATAALMARNYRAALQLFRAAAAENPRNPEVQAGLARSLFELHEYDEAAAACRRALDLDARQPAPRVTLSYIHGRRGEVDSCKQEALEAYRLSPEMPETMLCLGTALLAANDLDNSISLLQKAVEADPRNVNAHFNLSLALYRKGRLAEYLTEKRMVWRVKPSFRSLAEWLLAYCIRYEAIVGAVLAISLLLAVALRLPWLLLLVVLEAVTAALSGIVLVFFRQWRSGVLALSVATGMSVLLYLILVMFIR